MAPLDTVTIPRDRYDQLVQDSEDLADIRDAREALRKIEMGEEELIPAEFVNRILDGESPLRVFREMRGMTQAALAEASGISRVYIAQIEAKTKTGSVHTVKALAAALGVTLDDLA